MTPTVRATVIKSNTAVLPGIESLGPKISRPRPDTIYCFTEYATEEKSICCQSLGWAVESEFQKMVRIPNTNRPFEEIIHLHSF